MSTELLERPAPKQASPAPKKKKKRRRRRFSLNGLAIQLSAFALSFTLVALLVVSGSQAAFVEENEAVTNYVPIGQTEPPADGDGDWTPRSPSSPTSAAPTEPTEPPVEPDPELEPDPVVEVVELTDSDAGTAMFADGVPLAPGIAEERCIEVSYAGDVDPRPVMLYAAATDGPLAPYLDLTIDVGRADVGDFGSCSGFVAESTVFSGTLAGFVSAHPGYATGAPTWDPAGSGESRHFRFTVAVQDDPAAAGLSAVFGFSWETRDDA